ncbi:hypothetical protein CXB51_032771 [Gossypium anomalum]|uniref:Uncharacterized protein n=1 Tax=Gossypium anomalum TaxID=47600 RepID=A0A8J5YD53_9ROSI|nr:hypothetical protein CXB51_032771 [Gossypium anomalum]
MESSKIYGGIEECHSSESGWTMYIGSPIHGGDDSGDGHSEKADDEGVYGVDNHADEEADSDDSMASDASSGPSHKGHRGTTTLYFKHDEEEEDDDEDERNFFSGKKDRKSKEKKHKVGLMKNKQNKQAKKQTPLKTKTSFI